MEQDIVNGISLPDFIKKYGKENEYFYYKIINICEEDLKLSRINNETQWTKKINEFAWY